MQKGIHGIKLNKTFKGLFLLRIMKFKVRDKDK